MSDHYVILDRGESGFAYSDFATGTSDILTQLFSFRVHDGVTPTKVEVKKAIKAFQRFFENAQQVAASGFDVAG
jgi:hypothetical protein